MLVATKLLELKILNFTETLEYLIYLLDFDEIVLSQIIAPKNLSIYILQNSEISYLTTIWLLLKIRLIIIPNIDAFSISFQKFLCIPHVTALNADA